MAAKARFVSRFGNYSVGVQSLIEEHFGTGERRVLKPRIDANFHLALTTDEDFAVALQVFTFQGLPIDSDTNEHISPRFRVSVWDSQWAQDNEGWSDEQIDQIIEKLRATIGPDHVELAAKRATEPFPNFDTLSVDKVLEILDIAGLDPQSVIEYESENQNRKELLDILQGVTAGDDAVVVQA